MSISPALTKNAYAYEQVRLRIMNGELAPGQALAQSKLAAELGVSLTPMREALRRLDAEGLVTIDAHKNACVSTLTDAEARNLFTVRERLDPMAAALAAEHRTATDIEAIKAAAAAMKPLNKESTLEALGAHRDFHRAIYRASHNDVLINILDSLWDKADRYRQIALQERRDSATESKRVAAEHRQIMKAVIEGDAETAEEAMTTHVRESLGRLAIDVLANGTEQESATR
ncbi:GntR family transcriptional regulator [Paeniglutamicibacter sp. MACA_103]|uniref:GntR family transcriptional regulator n=1 Tax=Paeniglutamicibacter sp. MACA_103 TaxID=3377337 RepID=UPI003892F571